MQGIADEVAALIENYPPDARRSFVKIRDTVLLAATKNPQIGPVEESLKWGEPSYLTRFGSTLRISWKVRQADAVGVYFICRTSLIDTIREVHGSTFVYAGNRALLIPIEADLPEEALLHCFDLAMRYHTLKKLPLLGC